MNNPSQTLLPASGGTTTIRQRNHLVIVPSYMTRLYFGAKVFLADRARTNCILMHTGLRPKSRLLGLALMIGVPWSFFLLTGILFAFVYHWYVSMVWLLVSFLLFVSVLFIMVDYRNKTGGRWYMKLGLLSVVSVVLGVFASLYSYHHYFNNYWSYKENSEYINVLPSEPASAHSDAGKILFTLDSGCFGAHAWLPRQGRVLRGADHGLRH
ncbi:unnamed protein product [Amoebophrya sp. A120]|nr:unnamed protein product [Amoebophrya sp. A120]|eukprot:GSA120T00025246001.1